MNNYIVTFEYRVMVTAFAIRAMFPSERVERYAKKYIHSHLPAYPYPSISSWSLPRPVDHHPHYDHDPHQRPPRIIILLRGGSFISTAGGFWAGVHRNGSQVMDVLANDLRPKMRAVHCKTPANNFHPRCCGESASYPELPKCDVYLQ